MNLRSLLLCALSAAAYGLPYQYPVWPLVFASLVPLFLVCSRAAPAAAFYYGWFFGALSFAFGSPWLVGTLAQFLVLPLQAAAGVFAFYCALLGLQFGLAAGLARRLADNLRGPFGFTPAAAFAVASLPVWVAVEWLYPEQFPKSLALTLAPHLPQIQALELFGPAAGAWLIAAANSAGLLLAADRRWKPLAAAALLVAANEGYGTARMARVDAAVAAGAAAGGTLTAAVPQGAQTIRERGQEGKAELYAQLTREAAEQGPLDLVVWPEAAFSGKTVDCAGGAGEGLAEPQVGGRPLKETLAGLGTPGSHLLINAVARTRGERGAASYNAAMLSSPGGEYLGAVLKRHLIPFGEYLPLERHLPFLRAMNPNAADMRPGHGPGVLRMADGTRLGVLICYEDLLPAYARGVALKGADLFVHQATDVWFGGRLPEFHLNTGRLRAVEHRKFMLRAVESGVSALVDPAGRVVARLDFGARGYLRASAVRMPGATLYARLGDLLYAAAALAALGLALLPVFSRRRPGN